MKYITFMLSMRKEFARGRKSIADCICWDDLFGKFFYVVRGRPSKRLAIADLKKAHSSLLPNELLALPMCLKVAIGKTGIGTEVTVRRCCSWGLANPEFRDGPDFRIVIKHSILANKGSIANGGSVPVNSDVVAFLVLVSTSLGRGTALCVAKLGKTHRTIKRIRPRCPIVWNFVGGEDGRLFHKSEQVTP